MISFCKHTEFDIVFKSEKITMILSNINYVKDKFKILNWNKNRPADITRVNNITKYYIDDDLEIVPGIVYIWYNAGIYYIYDGLHRYTSALNNTKNMKILIHISYTEDENDIIKEFLNLNKSISVPTIYLDNSTLIKKQVCQNISDHLCRTYPTFVSPSRKPFIYNFNRDNLVEFISTLEINFELLNIEIYIIKSLISLNEESKFNILSGNISHPKKCDKYNFYLFYLEKSYIKKKIESFINSRLNI